MAYTNYIIQKLGTKNGLRNYLRIPLKITGSIEFNGEKFHTTLGDISSHGTSFTLPEGITLPNKINLTFTLPDTTETLQLEAEIKNTMPLQNRTKFGCAFTSLKDSDKQKLEKFLVTFMSFEKPLLLYVLASFILSLDSTIRLTMLPYLYSFSNTMFGTESGITKIFQGSYPLIIFTIFITNFIALSATDNITSKYFPFKILAIIPGLIFLTVKVFSYLFTGIIADVNNTFLRLLIFADIAFYLVALLSAVEFFKAYTTKRPTILDALKTHAKGPRRQK